VNRKSGHCLPELLVLL